MVAGSTLDKTFKPNMAVNPMQFNVSTRLPTSLDNACQVLFLFSDGKLKGSARKIDSASDGAIKKLFVSKDFSAKAGQTVVLHALKGITAERVLLVGLGERQTADAQRWREATQAAAKSLIATPASTAISDCLNAVTIENLDSSTMAEQLARDLVNATYVFSLHQRMSPTPNASLTAVFLSAEKKSVEAVTEYVHRGSATARGMSRAKDLGNLAPNVCTPTYLADVAHILHEEHDKLSTTVLDEAQMESMGMGAFLAISQGSHQPGKMIVMNYQGRKRAGSPIVLVGKGVTFDTGGISIKSSDGMDEMKYDMCGAASVFGVMQAVAELNLPLNVVGIVAAVENMPDGQAARPGDVVTSLSGQTIEILNTDAEGRMVLCDALTYAERFKPATVIDMATLTGACIVALGNVASAVMGNDPTTVDELLQASEQSGDRCWSLPLWDDYQKQLDSNFADIANIGGRPAGAITAACFLSRFAKNYHWAHLDIAGVAWTSGKQKGATGRPVPLLMQYLFNRLSH